METLYPNIVISTSSITRPGYPDRHPFWSACKDIDLRRIKRSILLGAAAYRLREWGHVGGVSWLRTAQTWCAAHGHSEPEVVTVPYGQDELVSVVDHDIAKKEVSYPCFRFEVDWSSTVQLDSMFAARRTYRRAYRQVLVALDLSIRPD
jgi:hypothetical protein